MTHRRMRAIAAAQLLTTSCLSMNRSVEFNMLQISEQEDVLDQEFHAVTSNAPLAFPHFDVVSHYMSQPRTPELEKSADAKSAVQSRKSSSDVKFPVESRKLSISKRKSSDGEHEARRKEKEMKKVAEKLEKLREKQRKVERKASETEYRYLTLAEKGEVQINCQDEEERKLRGTKLLLHRLFTLFN